MSNHSDTPDSSETLSEAFPSSKVIHRLSLLRLFEAETQRDAVTEKTIAAGTVLMKKGDPSDGVYLLRSGELEVYDEADGGRVHLNRLGAGACFGELGTLAGSPRAATIVAVTRCRVLFMTGPQFLDLYVHSAALRVDLDATTRAYQTSDGTIRQYSEQLLGRERVTTVFDRTTGHTIVSARTIGMDGYEIEALPARGERQRIARRLRARDEHGVLQYEVRLIDTEDGPIPVGMTAYTDRSDLSTTDAWIRERRPLSATMMKALEAGTVADTPHAGDLFCRCLRIPVSTVKAAIAAGVATPAAIQERTGCGTVCGSCRPRLLPLLEAEPVAAPDDSNVEPKWVPLSAIEPCPERVESAPLPPSSSPQRVVALVRKQLVPVMWFARRLPQMAGLAAVLGLISTATGTLTLVQAGVWWLFVGILFALDLRKVHGEWRAIFVDGVPEEVQINTQDRRPPGFSAPLRPNEPLRNRAIRGVVMARLSFGAWVYYKYSLRIVYTLEVMWRLLVHRLRRLFRASKWAESRRWSKYQQPFWTDIARQMAELVLESSLCMGLTEMGNGSSGATAIFRFEDWKCPAGPRYEGESIYINALVVEVDLEARAAIRCTVNGESLGVTSDALAILFLALTTYHHTLAHAYANWACVPNHPDPLLARAALFTLSLNATAVRSGNLILDNGDGFGDLLSFNAMKGMYPHGSGRLLSELCRHSRFAAFMVKARIATMDVLKNFEVDVDAEAFFLMSVVHSLDHHSAAVSCDPLMLDAPLLDSRGAEMIRVLFTEPLRTGLFRTKLFHRRERWAVELYRRLDAIDPEYAARIDYCITY